MYIKIVCIANAFMFLFFTTIQNNFAQIKIGDNPTTINNNSILEIESLNKGVRIPRLALTATTDAAPLTAHVDGMIVYNTANQNDVKVGMYINNGVIWTKLNTGTEANIYNENGTLTGNRNVSTGSNVLLFTNAANSNVGRVSIFNSDTESYLRSIGPTRGVFQTLAGTSSSDFSIINIFSALNGVNQIVADGSATGLNITTKKSIPLNFRTNDNLRMSISSTGNIGIGPNNTNPQATLDVNGNAKIRTLPEITNGKLLVAGTDGSLGVAPTVITTQGFFAQSGRATKFGTTELTDINNGDPIRVIYASGAVQFNNICTLSNSILTINVAGTYEVSGSLSVRPDATEATTANASIQVSRDNGSTWNPLTTSRSIYAVGNLRFFRTINISGAVAKLNVGDQLRVTITKPFGGDWGEPFTSNPFSGVSIGVGMPFSRTWKIIKL